MKGGKLVFRNKRTSNSRFGEHKEDMDKHADAENTENNVRPPLNVDETWRHEIAECEVYGPISRSRKRDSLTTHAEWIEFGWVDPRDRSPGGCIRCNEEVRARNQRFCGTAGYCCTGLRNVVDAFRASIMTCATQKAGIHKEPSGH